MAELMLFNPAEAFARGRGQAQSLQAGEMQNALLRREMDMQRQRPELIRNALVSGKADEAFAVDPALGAQVQQYLAKADEQERAQFLRNHEASARLVEWVEGLPEEQRGSAWGQVAPRINGMWGAEVVPASYDPMAAGRILAEARGISASLGSLPAGMQEFAMLTQGLTPEEIEEARRIRLGLSARASSAAVKTVSFKGADGKERLFLVNAEGSIIGPAGDEFVSPTEMESAQNTALGTGRGKTQAEREASAPKREESRRQLEATIDSVMGEVDKAINNTAWNTSGFIGSRLANIEGSPAYNLRATLDTIKANLGFDKLQAMREASPTGGALGAVSERELVLLTSAIASLDQAQSDDQLRASLQKIKRHYENWKEVIQEARRNDPYAPEKEETPDPLGIR